MRKIVTMTAVLLAAGACSKPAEAPAPAPSATPAPAAATTPTADVTTTAAPAAAAAPLDGPADGKWRITTTMTGVNVAIPPTETCYLKTSFNEIQKTRQGAGVECSEQSFKREGDAMVGHSACTIGGMKAVTDMRITGDMKTSYTMDMTTKMDPAPTPAMANQKITVHAERIGDC